MKPRTELLAAFAAQLAGDAEPPIAEADRKWCADVNRAYWQGVRDGQTLIDFGWAGVAAVAGGLVVGAAIGAATAMLLLFA
jgi:hypothetical protein